MGARPLSLGFVGLGDMGMPMARRLLSSGEDVVAWNRSSDKLAALAANGATPAASPAEVMNRADLIGLCLTSDEAVEQVAWGPNGFFSTDFTGRKFIADFSTGSPSAAISLSVRAAARGTSWVDAPVSGGVPAANSGTLTAFAGGNSDAIAALHPLLAPLCGRVSHMGAAGAGQATKLCNQMIVACNLLVIAETIAMARKAGVDVAALPAALKGGFADSSPLQIFGPRMAAHRFDPRLGAIELMVKDVRLATELSSLRGARTPSLALAGELCARACHQPGIVESADISCLIGLFESLSTEASV
jgi:3-hydroxyisobutyrate dehydrogenase-like beta-hydroxyacid dehydrogenase